MKKVTIIYMIRLVKFILCTAFIYAQYSNMIRLPTGEYVYDLSGEWDARIESYSQAAGRGAYSRTVKITQIGGTCPVTGVMTYPIIIRGHLLKDYPLQKPAVAASEIFRLNLEFDGINECSMVSDDGKEFSCNCEIRKNGHILNVEAPNHGKMTLVRK